MGLASIRAAAAQPPPGTQAGNTGPKRPATPLFPRHRRGLYRNPLGVEVIDATPQSPPLDTDDPGVPDNGAYEINVSTRTDYASAAQRLQLLSVDVNYGVLPAIAGYKLPSQIKIEFPLAAAHQAGEPFSTGLGAITTGMKLNFYRDDHRGISTSVYPQIEFAAPGGRGVEKGLAEKGATVIVPLLAAREFRLCTVVFNTGLEVPVKDPERSVAAEAGIAVGRALTRKVAAMLELRAESSVDWRDDRLLYINGGVIHGVRNLVVYGNVGRSLFAEDGMSHFYAGVGVKLLIDARHPTQ